MADRATRLPPGLLDELLRELAEAESVVLRRAAEAEAAEVVLDAKQEKVATLRKALQLLGDEAREASGE